MKRNVLRGVLFLIMILSCLAAAGCNKGAITAVSIHESGGEDGRDIDWKVYQDDNKYMLSYFDHRKKEAKQEIHEITEQEYDDIMSLNYAKFISEYDPQEWEGVRDAVFYNSVITYENGAEKSTEARMIYATNKLYELKRKYNN